MHGIALLAGVIGSMPVGPTLDRWRARLLDGTQGSLTSRGLAAASAGVVAAVLVAAIVQIAARTYNPFIYFRF
jgi:hypothetical protein